MPILPSASASASPKATHVPVFKAAPCVDSYAEFPQSSFCKLPLSLESGFDIETDHQQIANALQSQFRIKQQFKEQQQDQKQQLQHHETGLETLTFPSVQEPSRLSHGGNTNKSNKSQLIANDSTSISRSNFVNGSMVSIRSEQQLCQLYNAQQHSDYIISDYMDKIATRISLLETELKFAWRALDLLSNEYGKIWTRLEKLENISLEQQSVLNNLMELIAAAKQQQTDLEIGLDRELEVDLDFNVKAPFGSYVEVDNLSDESQKLEEIMDGHSHAFMDDLFVDDDRYGVALGPDEHDAANDELFPTNSSAEFQPTKRVDSWQGQESGLRNEALEKLYSDSNLLIYEQQQIMANNARAQLLQEFLNGQRVLEEVSSASTLDTIKQSTKAKKNCTSTANTLAALSTSNEVDEIVDKVQFFHLAANKTGQGGNEVVPIEDTGGTGTGTGEPQAQTVAEVNETFYKNLNEAYRQNNLTSEISNMERLLKQSETSTEHITTPAFFNLSAGPNASSSLMMIYEGNEEDNHDIDKDIAERIKTSVATSTTNLSETEHREPRKSLRKKKHRKNEMDMINNLKSILAKTSNSNMTLDTDYINICKPMQESNLFLYSERENRCSITSSSSEESGNANGETVAILDAMTDIMIREINKIRGLESLSAPQILQLRQTIRTEQEFFEKLNQVDKNLTLLLLNPVTMTEELQRLRVMEIDEKFNLVMKKFDKNIDTLKKLVGNSFESYKTNTIASSVPKLFKDPKTLNSLKETDYSEHLMRNNSDLDEQLKLIETQETEINRKKNKEEIVNLQKHEIDVNQSNVIYNTEPHAHVDKLSLSNESFSIYNQDEYIRSLKKSLERHNSMLFLLHLQNPEKHKATATANLDDFLLGTTSPPPPAPNDNLFDVEQPLVDPFTVKPELQHQQPQQKSDLDLSSVNGWSLHSPVALHNGIQHKYNDLTREMIQMMIEAGNNRNMFEQESKVNNHIFSEENLNYIHELSKNIPICSAYENKSMFNANSMTQINPTMFVVNDRLHCDENHHESAVISSRKTKCRIPDLLKNESQSHVTDEHTSGNYQETDIDVDLAVDHRRKPHLTDRLVFYPSTNGIADYNSSNNLAYLGLESFDNNRHMHNESNRKSTEGHAGSTNSYSPNISIKRQMLGKSPKVWNKISNFLPENLKLSRSMRYKSRSQSLPGSIVVQEKDSQMQGRGQASSYPLVATNLELSKRIQKLPMRNMRSAGTITAPDPPDEAPFSVAIKTQAKHKKRSFSLKMNHLMQKAKTYKRHSFGLRPVSSISEPEMSLTNYILPNDNDSPSSDNHSENNDIERDDDKELEGRLNVDFYDSPDNYGGDDMGKNLFAVVGDIKKTNADMPEIFVDSNEIVKLNEPPQSAASSTSVFINIVEDENVAYPFHTTECSTLNITSEEKIPTRTSVSSPKLNNWVQQQHSLDIPSNRDDDDNRSQYSGRTLSSSRRQSTEDSIDTDDEYFCYELRQLEELEKQTVAESQLEMDVGQALNEDESTEDAVLFTQIGQLTKNESTFYVNKSNENESLFSQIGQLTICDSLLYNPLDLHPDENVKKKMLVVLSELKSVVRVEPDIETLDQSVDADNDKNMDVKKPNLAQKCAQVLDIHSAWQDNNFEVQLPMISNYPETNCVDYGGNSQDWQEDKRVLETLTDTKIRNDQIRQGPSSSSSQSLSYSEEEYDAINKQTAQSHLENVDVDSLHEDLSSGATSGPDSPAGFSDEIEEDDSINGPLSEAGLMKNSESISMFAGSTQLKSELPNAIQLDPQEHVKNTKASVNNNNILEQSDQLNVEDSQVVNTENSSANTANAGSSKWKLLKTLKERKIEEKNNQDKIKEEELAKENKKVMWL